MRSVLDVLQSDGPTMCNAGISPTECPSLALLSRLLDDRLTAAEGDQIESHLSGCARCQEALSQLSDDPDSWPSLVDLLRRRPGSSPQETTRLVAERTVSTPLQVPGYEILEELGRGGAGIIYRAQDKQLRRIVALKVLASLDPEHAVRFRNEAEAAARLQHPHIIEVFSSGMCGDRMYLVMELVEGGDLAARLKHSPLSAKQAARLVEMLAGAVHQAHLSGILHRDLKPANILLQSAAERQGESVATDLDLIPKITDFGLAYWTKSASSPTQTGERIGTPGYMPPEQVLASSGWATERVDVYALGAVLYECLTGRPPFQAESSAAVLHRVLHSDPIPPRRLNPRLSQDLETICLKCLEKSPAARYATARELGEDLRRLLNHEPILARAPSAWQRLVKWTYRYPAAAVFLLTSALAVSILLASFSWFAITLRRERAEQVRRSEDALRSYLLAKEAVAAVLDLSSSEVDELGVVTPNQQRILEKARTLFVQFTESQSDDLEIMGQQADAMKLLTRVELAIDLQLDSLETADEAIALYRRLVQAVPDVPAYRDSLQECLRLKGVIGRSLARFDEAITAYDEAIALALASDSSTNQPPAGPTLADRADAYAGRGWCFLRQREYRRAIEDYEQAIDAYEQLVERAPGDSEYWQRLGKTTYQSALAHFRSGERKQGDVLLRDSLEQRERALALEPTKGEYRWSVAISLTAIAREELHQGNAASARPKLLRSFRLITEAAQQNPHNHRLRYWQGAIHVRLSELALAEEDKSRAGDELRLALDIYEELALQYPHIGEYVDKFMESLVSLRMLHEQGDGRVDTNSTYERELAVRRKVVEAVGRNYETLGLQAISHAHFATALMQQEKEDEALRHAEASLALLHEALANASPERSGKSPSVRTESLAALLRACALCWTARQRAEEPTHDLLLLAHECLRQLKARAKGEAMLDEMKREPAVTAFLGELDSLTAVPTT